MSNPSVFCSKLSGTQVDLGPVQPVKYRDSLCLTLRQFWKGSQALPAERGTACLGAAADGLCFYVCFYDSDIFSTATADNQKMWTLGDVAEFFVKPGTERSDYWEIHITPNGFITDIHIPNREKFSSGQITWEQVVAANSHAVKRVEILDGKWAVELIIPWIAFGLDSKPDTQTVWQFAVCRYNYNCGLDDPEHSSTACLSALSFHRHEEFSDLLF